MLQTGQRDPSTRKINNTVAIQRIIHFSKGGASTQKGKKKKPKEAGVETQNARTNHRTYTHARRRSTGAAAGGPHQ
jgi:hypothetical protein